METEETKQEKKKGFIDVSLEGFRNGLGIWFKMLVPGTMFGYALVQIFQVLGILDILGKVFGPIMAVFGLPGEAITVLFTSALVLPGGCASAASLAAQGILTGREVTILFPMIFCVSNQIQFLGRVLSTARVPSKKYWVYCVIGIVCAAICGLVMNALL